MTDPADLREESRRAERHKIGSRRRPVDLVHLARQTSGDPQLEAEVLAMFAQMSVNYLHRLRDSGDSDALELNLHALKGASLGIGANSIAEHARCAETELKETGSICQETMDDLAVAVEEARSFISNLLAD